MEEKRGRPLMVDTLPDHGWRPHLHPATQRTAVSSVRAAPSRA